MSHIEADPQVHVGPAVLLLLPPAPVQPRLALLLVRVPALERGLAVRDGLAVVERGELDLPPAPVSQPAVRAELHHLLRVLQGEVELQVVQAAAAPLAQQLQVSRVELHRITEVEEGLRVATTPGHIWWRDLRCQSLTLASPQTLSTNRFMF